MIKFKNLQPIVTFSVTFDHRRFYHESELENTSDRLIEKLQKSSTIEGAINIVMENSNSVIIVDELAPWVQNLCFGAIPKLCSKEVVRVFYFSRSGFLELTPNEDKVELNDSHNDRASYPLQDLLIALVECGNRFMRLFQNIKREDLDYIANLEYVSQFEEPARLALIQLEKEWEN